MSGARGQIPSGHPAQSVTQPTDSSRPRLTSRHPRPVSLLYVLSVHSTSSVLGCRDLAIRLPTAGLATACTALSIRNKGCNNCGRSPAPVPMRGQSK